MKSKLSTEILARKERSRFMRSEEGRFALREWQTRISEHVADRFQKALFDEDILVFDAKLLSRFVAGRGVFRDAGAGRELAGACFSMRRQAAEEDLSVIQLVSVFIVRNADRVLTYKRAKRLPEARLHGYYSLSFGGHLNPDDVPPLFDILDAKQWLPWLTRELHEEVRFDETRAPDISYVGLLYDDTRPVSRQHLGIVYDVRTKSEAFQIGERGFLMDAKYETLDEIRGREAEFENWSLLLLETLGPEWR
jgi:predicted NUDIX family phosphoesterase